MKRFVLFFALLLPCFPASADIYNYFPAATLHLGGSFDPLDLTRVTPDCFVSDGETAVDGISSSPVTSQMHFSIRQVKDSRELHTLLKTSVTVAGHYSMFSADAGFNSTSQFDSFTDSTSWVLTADADYGRYQAKNLRLSKSAATLAHTDPEGFVQGCGTEVVMQVARGVSISVIFTLNNASQQTQNDMEADFNASVGGSMWGVDASASMSQSLKESIRHGDLVLNVVAVGGDGLPGLAQLITALKDSDTVADAKTVLESYTKSLGFAGGAIVSYRTGPIYQFVPSLRLPSFTLYNELIGEYYFALGRNLAWSTQLRDLLSAAGDFDPSTVNTASQLFELARQRAFEITSSAQKCRDKEENVVRDIIRNADKPSKKGASVSVFRASAAVEDDLRADLSQARLGDTTKFKQISLKNKFPQVFSDSASSSCDFKTEWINFSEFSKIKLYPFDPPVIWTDPLGQAPSNFLYARVQGDAIGSAKLWNPYTGQDILVFPQAANKFEGMFDLASDPANRPISLEVVTKTGHVYEFRAFK